MTEFCAWSASYTIGLDARVASMTYDIKIPDTEHNRLVTKIKEYRKIATCLNADADDQIDKVSYINMLRSIADELESEVLDG